MSKTQKTEFKRRKTLIIGAVGMISKGLVALHSAALEAMAHAKEYGDVSLCVLTMQSVKDNCKGVVVAGLDTWFKEHSPVSLKVEEGQVKGKLLKEGEKGYKPFDLAKAEAEPALETKEVKNRTNRPIEKMSVKLLKARIKGLAEQVKKAGEADGRGYEGETDADKAKAKRSCELFMQGMLASAETITFIDAPKEVKAKSKKAA